MKSDNAICNEAIETLINALGMVDTERFITMIKRDIFDYTEWRRKLWNDKNIEEIHNLATKYENDHN